jgi:hypothetical protein
VCLEVGLRKSLEICTEAGFIRATVLDYLPLVRLALLHGALNASDALACAAKGGHAEVMRLLLRMA